MKCCLCGNQIEVQSNGWDKGHNPAPLSEDGRCCDYCNTHQVIPARLGLARWDIDFDDPSENNHLYN